MAASARTRRWVVTVLGWAGLGVAAPAGAQSGLFGPDPIFRATLEGDLQGVRALVRQGASVHARDNRGFTPLFHAAENGDFALMDYFLGEAGARIDETDTVGNTALLYAAGRGDYAVADHLLGAGANPNHANRQGVTPLMRALANGFGDVAELLLEAGADANARDFTGNRVLDWARRGRQPGLESLLRAHGAAD